MLADDPRHVIAEQYLTLINNTAEIVARPRRIDWHDLVSIGYMVAFRCGIRFQQGRGCRTRGTYLKQYMARQMVRAYRSDACSPVNRQAAKVKRDFSPIEKVGATVEAKEGDPAVHIELQDDIRSLRAALETLPAKNRRCIHLYYFEGLTLQQISDTMGVTREAVRQRMLRGIQILRYSMKVQGVPHDDA